MNKPWKVILAFTGIFLAGILVGASVALRWGKNLSQRGPRSEQFGAQLMQRLVTRLELTPEQQEKVQPMVTRAADELREMRRSAQRSSAAVLMRMHGEVAAVLTPEQKAKLDEMVALQRERWKRFGEERGRRLRDKLPPR